MSQYLTFLVIGFGAGAAYVAIALGVVVTHKGTGIINFAAGALGGWACYMYLQLRSGGELFLPIPVNSNSSLGSNGQYGGIPLVLLTVISGALLFAILEFLVVRPATRRWPRYTRRAHIARWILVLVWAVLVFLHLRGTGRYLLPVIPYHYNLGTTAFLPAFLLSCALAAVTGLVIHALIFRPLRTAPPLAKVVASVGVMTTFEALIAFRFGTVSQSAPSVLPSKPIHLGATSVPSDRIYLAVIAIAVGVVIWGYFRFTRTGLATVAAAENERAASLARFSPQFLAGTNWVIASVATAILLILTLQVTPVTPTVHTLMIVPAVACALVGRLKYVGPTVAAGLGLGIIQSEFTLLITKDWWPSALRTGVSDVIPFVILIIVLFITGKSLPTRGALREDPLPRVLTPKNRPWVIALLACGGVVALLATSGSYRFGIITSMIFTIATLSIMLLTGLVGQISLAQAGLAGIAGFSLSKLSTNVGIGFPWSLLIAALLATAFGVVIGIPAVRIRGAQLAIVTLAAAVALQSFIFDNPSFTKSSGNPIPSPKLFGLDLGIRSGQDVARWQFGVLVLVILVVATLLVANLMQSATGRRFLAIRSNERASAAAGINVTSTKLLAFGIASFLAGIAGGLIGYSRSQLSAASFATIVNITFLAFAYLGGITSISGAMIGGTLAPLGIGFVISDRLFHVGSVYTLIGGLGLIVTAVLNPIGIAGANRQSWDRIKEKVNSRRRRTPTAATTSELPVQVRLEAEDERGPGRTREHHVRTKNTDVLLRICGLSVVYGGVRAVDDVNLQVGAGEVVGLIGPNGAGKTSLVDALTGFTAAHGRIDFLGEWIESMAPHARARRGLVRTWQAGDLFDDLSVQENLRVAAESASIRGTALDFIRPKRHTDEAQVAWALRMARLSAFADRSPRELSVGQRKLLGVARALAADPKVVLLDEPAAGLDSEESRVLGLRLQDIAEQGTSVFLIDHDMGLVLETCDYVYVLEFGKIIAEGTAAEVRSNPAVIEAYLGQSGEKKREEILEGIGGAHDSD